FSRDWSSDVCSSDLGDLFLGPAVGFCLRTPDAILILRDRIHRSAGGDTAIFVENVILGRGPGRIVALLEKQPLPLLAGLGGATRSEERRVGKEGDCR